MSYTSVTISGYNTNPPPNDGSNTTSNQVKWATIKTKLFDPLNTGLASMDANISSAVSSIVTDTNTLTSSVSTLSSNVSSLATALSAPALTGMIFNQTTPPTNWTKVTSYDDYALRLVTGTASTGGTTAFTSVFASKTLVLANLPAHTHTISDSSSISSGGTFLYDASAGTGSGSAHSGGKTAFTSISKSSSSLSGTFSVSGTTSSYGTATPTALDFAIQYVDVIYAYKAS
ncbi:MAG TPA: hypothetical protein VIY48_07105 [Candidatus Paceibacterota bacterium]